MEKTDKSITEETKDDEIVELKDEELTTITAGLRSQNLVKYDQNGNIIITTIHDLNF